MKSKEAALTKLRDYGGQEDVRYKPCVFPPEIRHTNGYSRRSSGQSRQSVRLSETH